MRWRLKVTEHRQERAIRRLSRLQVETELQHHRVKRALRAAELLRLHLTEAEESRRLREKTGLVPPGQVVMSRVTHLPGPPLEIQQLSVEEEIALRSGLGLRQSSSPSSGS